VPEGWTGPVVVHDSALGGVALACEGEFAVDTGVVYASLQAEPAVCDCSCGEPQGSVRCRPHFEMHIEADCQGTSFASLDPLNNSGCSSWSQPGVSSFQSVNVTELDINVTEGVECLGSLEETIPGAVWQEALTMCGAMVEPVECSSGTLCLGAPPEAFNLGFCVFQEGNVTCPGGYPNRLLRYASFDDTRGCGACSCGAPSGFSCDWSFVISDDAVCTETPLSSTGCVSFDVAGGAIWWRNTSVLSGGECAPSGGEPLGAANPASPVTVCCAG